MINLSFAIEQVYRLNQDVAIVNFPATLSGEDVLPDFKMNIE